MRADSEELFAACAVPHLYRAIVTGRCQSRAVWAETHAPDLASVECEKFAVRSQVPEVPLEAAQVLNSRIPGYPVPKQLPDMPNVVHLVLALHQVHLRDISIPSSLLRFCFGSL